MEKCHDCGREFKRTGLHWARTSCDYPEYTKRQKEIVRGLLLGDGYLNTKSKPSIAIGSTNKEFLEWIVDEMDDETGGIRFVHVTDAGSDYYSVRIRYNPYLDAHTWAQDTKGDWPKHMRITPLVMGLWYAGDGHYYKDRDNAEIGVTIKNNRRYKIVQSYLEQAGLDARIGEDRIHFRKDETPLLQAYSTEIPGYEWKWK